MVSTCKKRRNNIPLQKKTMTMRKLFLLTIAAMAISGVVAQTKAKETEQKERVYPKSFSNIGITVPNLQEAVKSYSEVMGWYVIMSPTEIKEEHETAIGKMCIDVFGTGWGSFRIAHLATVDKIGIELFEFKQSKDQKPTLWRICHSPS